MKQGDVIPSVCFKGTQGLEAGIEDYRGKWLILYFYPRDATPGCTLEGENFRDAHAEFLSRNAVVLGVSRDTLSCHERFKTKHSFPFDLIDDSEEHLCQLFEVIKNKIMYGKSVRGIERSTFIINPSGVLVHEWRKVSVEGHVKNVLATLVSLQANIRP